ncbi:IS110 family transposase [Romboutsia ilealis]|jgi:transposase|uniref:IS110 family transposase n=1 Tax=Romboutsia ilealis TaxID=1115758 RepID=UPI00272BE2ED|nr:IS110 family transposase [Romboutsia ilealis]MCI9017105.1 IS110 family transposase [Clostridia bacterium]MCI9247356.1 IS110 family transposase [Clostridia bacterium]
MFYLGIDIAKVNHVASLINQDGSILVKAIKFTNSNEGLQKLIDSISEYDQSQIYCAMEATGTYWLSLFSALTDKGFNVSVFNPYQIKSFRGAYTNRKQKNDVIDSILIANFLSFNGTKQTPLPNDDLLALKNLTRYRSNLVSNISKAKTQVTGILDKVFPEYSDFFSDTFGEASKQILLNCPTPNEVINFNTRKLANLLKKVSRGRHSTDKVREVKSLAKNSFGIKFTGDACSFEIKQLVNQIIFLENQAHELEVKIKELYSKLDNHLQSIPGIGEVTAPVILAEIGDINNFSTPSKLTAFAGIDPSENQSGNKKSTDGKTSKRGSPYLRHAIYLAAMVASNNDPIMHDYYIKKRAEGKHHYVALAGVERKLLGIIFHVLKENRDYRPPKSS